MSDQVFYPGQEVKLLDETVEVIKVSSRTVKVKTRAGVQWSVKKEDLGVTDCQE